MATTWNVGHNAAGTLLDFSDPVTAHADANVVAGDTLLLWYSDASLCRTFQTTANFVVSKAITIKGALSNQQVALFLNSSSTSLGYVMQLTAAATADDNFM